MAPVTAAQLAVAPPNGLALLSGGQFEVNGVNTFATPVSITFPLTRRLPGGSTVPLWQLEGGAWRITDSPLAPVDAQVSQDGRSATTAVRHFTVYAILADYAPFSPLSVGASWTYERTIQTTGGPPGPPEPDISTVVATITGTGTVGGLTTYVWSEEATSGPSQKLYFHRSASAPYELLLVAIEEEGQALDVLSPPAKVLMLPPASGQTWEVTTGLFDTTAQAAVTAETITVGGAECDTMKVHIAPPSGGYMDIWWAPDVGPVKRKQSFVEPGVGTVVIEMDLQSYSLP
jgi:hypothetical protein